MATVATTITRTITIGDLRPQELAVLFCGLDSLGQADFFGEVWAIAREWPGAGWCQQSYAISEALDADGREAIRVLAGHALADEASA